MNEYDVMESCNKCGGNNDVVEKDSMWHSGMDVLSEVETTCKDCGFQDYWAHGRFESHLDGFNVCEKYQGAQQ